MTIFGSRYIKFADAPRWTRIQNRKELHAFADVSEKAYTAIIYLREIGLSEYLHYLVAKIKVASLKLISIS